MKNIIIGFVSLLAGVGIGLYFEHTRSDTQAWKDLDELSESQQMDAAAAATFAVAAIQSIDSGQTKKAEQFLSLPIAHYCVDFHFDSSTNESLRKLRSRIDRLAQTNQIVAAQISNEMRTMSIK